MIFESAQWLPFPVDEVFRFFADPRNLPRLMPAARLEQAHLVPPPGKPEDVAGLAGAGSELRLTFALIPGLPLRLTWKARIVEFEWNRFFRDVQIAGPFRRWDHRHEFEPAIGAGGRPGTWVRDRVQYEVGGGALGRLARVLLVRRQLQRAFARRRQAVARLLARPAPGGS